jgi:hypothetical protein
MIFVKNFGALLGIGIMLLIAIYEDEFKFFE